MNRTVWIIIGVIVAVAVLVGIVIVATDEGEISESAAGEPSPAATDVSGTVSAMAVWTGAEQDSFQAVIDAFNEVYPDVTVNYNSAGDQLPTVLGTAVEGGNPPDVAVVPQPGLMNEYAERGELVPLDFARDTIDANYAEGWITLGSFDDQLYGLVFKGANKSTVWYNVNVLSDAGITEPPATWDDLVSAADTVGASGVPAWSIAGADGWTLTDWFENVYLRTAGPDMYDQLAAHEIPWTDQSVVDALTTLQDIFGDKDNIAGNPLQVDFPTSVTQVFKDDPDAAMVYEGDFVQGVILDSTTAQPEADFNVFDFPSIDGSAPAVVGGGDMVIMFNDSPAAQAFVEYLATPEAAEVWAARGGFSSPNMNVDPSVYPDALTQQTATALAEAETFRFDMSDLAPSAFGGTPGQGEWQILQDFLRDPGNPEQTAQQLEDAAARAYGNQ
jgi:ABC-type glycerol-3-phosphate transport system substrate-binding protein